MTLYLVRLSSDKNWDDKNTLNAENKWEAAEKFAKENLELIAKNGCEIDVKNKTDGDISHYIIKVEAAEIYSDHEMEFTDQDYAIRVAKRAFYLAWDACGGPTGLGFLQEKSDASEEEIWERVFPNRFRLNENKSYISADYLFGRMVKLRIELDGNYLRVTEKKPTAKYHAWCHKYQTYKSLLDAAKLEIINANKSTM